MVPRLRFDIPWRDIASAAWQCMWPLAIAERVTAEAESSLGSGEAIATLSVRTAFDLLLTALQLPPGSEVLLSEVTVPHMLTILREHGLKPVGIPVDPRTLQVDASDVESRLTSRSKLILIAHLFGAHIPLEAIAALARERGILLVEDSAQALVSGTPHRSKHADVTMYSFGPIKTATALGGGLALVKDESLRARMASIAAAWPKQSRLDYLQRVMKISMLKFLSYPAVLSLLTRAVRAVGGDADRFVGGSARGFTDRELFTNLRKQPCAAMQKLIARRLQHFEPHKVIERTKRGQWLAGQIGKTESVYVAGCDNSTHTFWVFPLVCKRPDVVVEKLRSAGFDASQISGLTVVAERPQHWFRQTVFVPHSAVISRAAQQEMATLVAEAVASHEKA